MERKLVRANKIWHFDDEGRRIYGAPDSITGDLSGVTGDLSGVTGDLSGVSGNVSGVTGDLSGVSGNVNNCKLTADDRKNGVDISELIREEE